jgi:hypothetical protein
MSMTVEHVHPAEHEEHPRSAAYITVAGHVVLRGGDVVKCICQSVYDLQSWCLTGYAAGVPASLHDSFVPSA